MFLPLHHICTTFGSKQVVEVLGQGVVHTGQHRSVHVERGADRGMAEPLLDHLGMGAELDHQTGGGVPWTVEGEADDSSCLHGGRTAVAAYPLILGEVAAAGADVSASGTVLRQGGDNEPQSRGPRFETPPMLNCMMDVQRLRLLRELAERGTVTAVAKACWLTPSAVSQQLSSLEREAGVKLTERDGRRLRLTGAGERLVGHAHRILADLEEAQADLAGLGSASRGTVRVAAFPTAARAVVPQMIEHCHQEYPDLRVVVQEHEADYSIPALRAREIDAALVYEYDLLPEFNDPSIELTPLFEDPVLVLLSGEHFAVAEEVCLGKLRDEPWIAPNHGTICHAAVLQACELSGFRPRVEFTSGDYAVTVALVEARLGVALVPKLALSYLVTSALPRPVAGLRPRRTVSLAIRRGGSRDPGIAALATALFDAVRPFSPATESAPELNNA